MTIFGSLVGEGFLDQHCLVEPSTPMEILYVQMVFVQQPPAPRDHAALEMWLLQRRNCVLRVGKFFKTCESGKTHIT